MKMIKWLILTAVLLPLSCTSAQDTKAEYTQLAPEAFKTAISANDSPIIIDVRTPNEFQEGHIEGATLINFYDGNFQEQINTLPKDETIYIYCRSGNRSGQAANMMLKSGFGKIVELDGGMNAWYSSGNK